MRSPCAAGRAGPNLARCDDQSVVVLQGAGAPETFLLMSPPASGADCARDSPLRDADPADARALLDNANRRGYSAPALATRILSS